MLTSQTKKKKEWSVIFRWRKLVMGRYCHKLSISCWRFNLDSQPSLSRRRCARATFSWSWAASPSCCTRRWQPRSSCLRSGPDEGSDRHKLKPWNFISLFKLNFLAITLGVKCNYFSSLQQKFWVLNVLSYPGLFFVFSIQVTVKKPGVMRLNVQTL